MSLMDALEPGRSMHNAMLSTGVISTFLLLSTCFYLRYGPEPIIPDPELQQLCYNHGYSSSIRRSLVSYVVYSCVVFIVMSCCDPSYGLLVRVAKEVYDSSYAVFDAKALLVLGVLACAVTLLAAVCSATITWVMEVDEYTSMKLSRSVHDACQRMVICRRSSFDGVLTQVLREGSDAHLAEAYRTGSRSLAEPQQATLERPPVAAPSALPQAWDEDSFDQEQTAPGSSSPPRCRYFEMGEGFGPAEDIESERQLRANPVPISAALCLSVLAYDVLGLVICFQWGALALRCYSVLFGRLASVHDALYMLSVLLYAVVVVMSLSKFVFSWFPSAEELAAAPRCKDSARAVELVAATRAAPREAARAADGEASAETRAWWSRFGGLVPGGAAFGRGRGGGS